MTEGDDWQIRPKAGGGYGTDTDEFVERFNAEGSKGTAVLVDLLAQGMAAREILEAMAGPVPEHATHWLETDDNASRTVAVLNLVATVGQPFQLAVGTHGKEIRLILRKDRVAIQVIS